MQSFSVKKGEKEGKNEINTISLQRKMRYNFPVLRGVTTLEEALDPQNAYKNVAATAYQVFRLLI